MSNLNVAVVGAGIIGLTTALELQKQLRNAEITIVADKLFEETTSYVAAGIFRPGTSFSGPTEDITRKWIADSYEHWESICYSEEGPLAGVTEISGYAFASEHPHIVQNSYIENIVPIYRKAQEKELKLCAGNWKYGSFYKTLLVECSFHLPWAVEKFKRQGGRIEKRRISNFDDISNRYDLIVNCSGLGAKFLCHDNKLVPIRGQIIKVQAPWLKTFFYGDFDTYIIPGLKSVTLGGCKQYDSYNLNVDKYDSRGIYERCTNLLPALKTAPVIGEMVGLRPHRDPVRVEKEIIVRAAGKNSRLVHNYGHGSYGVTTAPGTSVYAVKLVTEYLKGDCKL